jgi:hypothetical protein
VKGFTVAVVAASSAPLGEKQSAPRMDHGSVAVCSGSKHGFDGPEQPLEVAGDVNNLVGFPRHATSVPGKENHRGAWGRTLQAPNDVIVTVIG